MMKGFVRSSPDFGPHNTDLHGSGTVHWMYPDIYERPHGADALTVILYSVRATCPLVIRFEAERNVWAILVEDTLGYETRGDCGYPVTRLREVATISANEAQHNEDSI